MTDYTRSDVKAAKARILADCPGYEVEDWGDYGYKLTAFKPPNGPGFVVYQPYRPENGQPHIQPESLDAVVETLNKAQPL